MLGVHNKSLIFHGPCDLQKIMCSLLKLDLQNLLAIKFSDSTLRVSDLYIFGGPVYLGIIGFANEKQKC